MQNRPTTERQFKLLAQKEEPQVLEGMLDRIDTHQYEQTNFAVVRTATRGCSVITLKDIPPKTIVLRYYGELIRGKQGRTRETELRTIDKFVYFRHADISYCIDSQTVSSKPLHGTLGRLVNHARGTAENCEMLRHQRADGRICLYLQTLKPVKAFCNLYWDYGERRAIAIEANPWLAEDVPENEWFVRIGSLATRFDLDANVMVFAEPSAPAPGFNATGSRRTATRGRGRPKSETSSSEPPTPGASTSSAPGFPVQSPPFDPPTSGPLQPTDQQPLANPALGPPESYEELAQFIGHPFDVCDLPTRLTECGVLREIGLSKQGKLICYFAFEGISDWNVWYELSAVRHHSSLSTSTFDAHRAIMRGVTAVSAVEVGGYFYEVLMNDWCSGLLFCRLHHPQQPTFTPDTAENIFRGTRMTIVIPYESVTTHPFQPFMWSNPNQVACRLPDAQTLAECTLGTFLPPQAGLYKAPALRPASIYRTQENHERNLRSKQGGPSIPYTEPLVEDDTEGEEEDEDQPLSSYTKRDLAHIKQDGGDTASCSTANDTAPPPEIGTVYESEDDLLQATAQSKAANDEFKATVAAAKRVVNARVRGGPRGRGRARGSKSGPAKMHATVAPHGAALNPTGAAPKPLKRVKAPSAIFGDDAILETAEQLDNRIGTVASSTLNNRLSTIERQLESAYMSYANRLEARMGQNVLKPSDLEPLQNEVKSLRADFGGLQESVRLLVVEMGALATTFSDQFSELKRIIVGSQDGGKPVTALRNLNNSDTNLADSASDVTDNPSTSRAQKRSVVVSPKQPPSVCAGSGRTKTSPEVKQRRRSTDTAPFDTRVAASPISVRTNPHVSSTSRSRTPSGHRNGSQKHEGGERRRCASVGPSIDTPRKSVERTAGSARASGGRLSVAASKFGVGATGFNPPPIRARHLAQSNAPPPQRPTVVSIGGISVTAGYGQVTTHSAPDPRFRAPNTQAVRFGAQTPQDFMRNFADAERNGGRQVVGAAPADSGNRSLEPGQGASAEFGAQQNRNDASVPDAHPTQNGARPLASGQLGQHHGGASGQFGAQPTENGARLLSPGQHGQQHGASGEFGAQPAQNGARPFAPGQHGQHNGASGQFGAQPTQNGARPFAPGQHGQHNGASGEFGAQPTQNGARPFAPGQHGHQNGASGQFGAQPAQNGARPFAPGQHRQHGFDSASGARGQHGVNVVNTHYNLTSSRQVSDPPAQFIAGQQQIISPAQNQHRELQVGSQGQLLVGGYQLNPASVTVGNSIHQQHSYLNVMQQHGTSHQGHDVRRADGSYNDGPNHM